MNQQFQSGKHVLFFILAILSLMCFLMLSGSDSGQTGMAFAQDEPTIDLYRTAPGDMPRFDVTQGAGSPGTGYVFMSPFDFTRTLGVPPYLLILDNNGEPVYYQRMKGLPTAMDFKLHDNGLLTYYDRRQEVHVALNNQYEVVTTLPANGYTADLHDIQILDNGHIVFLVYNEQVVDMSQLVEGGQPDAVVVACVIQEVDEQGTVVFEWNSLDHIDILDSTRDFTADHINYMNCNSIEGDQDGHLLLSSRNLDEITKINRQTGEIIWRMGGKKNEFTFTNGGDFYRQHDARRLDNGHMSLYDNGVFHTPPYSRGLEIEVDEVNKTVTVVREFRNTPDAYAGAMGNMQRLPGGNTVIGWGRSNAPAYAEFDALGNRMLQFDTIQRMGSYRAFRFPWQGYPNWPPVVVAQSVGKEVQLFFSWNGSTEVENFMVFASSEQSADWHVATVSKDGFETSYQFSVPHGGMWQFWVIALDKDFDQLKQSERTRLLVGGWPTYLPMVVGSP